MPALASHIFGFPHLQIDQQETYKALGTPSTTPSAVLVLVDDTKLGCSGVVKQLLENYQKLVIHITSPSLTSLDAFVLAHLQNDQLETYKTSSAVAKFVNTASTVDSQL